MNLVVDIQQLKVEALIQDVQGDFSVYWVFTDKLQSSCCVHQRLPVIFINLRATSEETFEETVEQIQFHYVHEMLHAFGGPETCFKEFYLSALCNELLNLKVENALFIKKAIVEGLLREKHYDSMLASGHL